MNRNDAQQVASLSRWLDWDPVLLDDFLRPFLTNGFIVLFVFRHRVKASGRPVQHPFVNVDLFLKEASCLLSAAFYSSFFHLRIPHSSVNSKAGNSKVSQRSAGVASQSGSGGPLNSALVESAGTSSANDANSSRRK
jgi:hypothetical protein